jgi:hypothetical protein
MSTVALKKDGPTPDIPVVKKMKDYSKDPAFKKQATDALAFIKKHGLPKSFKKKKK